MRLRKHLLVSGLGLLVMNLASDCRSGLGCAFCYDLDSRITIKPIRVGANHCAGP